MTCADIALRQAPTVCSSDPLASDNRVDVFSNCVKASTNGIDVCSNHRRAIIVLTCAEVAGRKATPVCSNFLQASVNRVDVCSNRVKATSNRIDVYSNLLLVFFSLSSLELSDAKVCEP